MIYLIRDSLTCKNLIKDCVIRNPVFWMENTILDESVWLINATAVQLAQPAKDTPDER